MTDTERRRHMGARGTRVCAWRGWGSASLDRHRPMVAIVASGSSGLRPWCRELRVLNVLAATPFPGLKRRIEGSPRSGRTRCAYRLRPPKRLTPAPPGGDRVVVEACRIGLVNVLVDVEPARGAEPTTVRGAAREGIGRLPALRGVVACFTVREVRLGCLCAGAPRAPRAWLPAAGRWFRCSTGCARAVGSGTNPATTCRGIVRLMSFSISRRKSCSSTDTSDTASPVAPARPVRPIR